MKPFILAVHSRSLKTLVILVLLLFTVPDWAAHALPVTTITIQSGFLFGGDPDDFAGGFRLQAPEFDFAIFGPGMGEGPSYHFRLGGSAQKGIPSDLSGGVSFANSGGVHAIQSGVSFGDFPTFLSGFLQFSVVIPDPQPGVAVAPFSLTGEVIGGSDTVGFHYLLNGGGVVQAFLTDPAPFCAPCPRLDVFSLRFDFTTGP